MTNRYIYITLLAILGFSNEGKAQDAQMNSAPRLVLSIAIDQLRSDYLEAFAPAYSAKGLKRLLHEGRVYSHATYPFAPIDRASAIASIATGVTPYYNNIIGQQWLNRQTLRPTGCVDDKDYPGIETSDASSAAGLSTSTLGDELKVATGGKSIVYAIAPFRDAAVLSAGHAADGALWIDDASGRWCSSKYFFQSFPSWVSGYNSLYSPATKVDGVQWEPFNEFVGSFNYFMHTGEEKPFKHSFTGFQRFQQYKTSGLVNADITDLAIKCMASTGMGTDKVTDLLSLTYYAGNYDHQAASDSQLEIQDTYIRLDSEIGKLMTYVDEHYGLDNVLLIVTSTGYSDMEPTDYQKYRIPSGTIQMGRTTNILNMYLSAIWGQGIYVESFFKNQIFLNHKILENKKISITDATNRSQEILVMMSGIRNVYTSLQLMTNQNLQIEKIRNGFNPERCGDLLLDVAPGWQIVNEDTNEHELSMASFIQFPIIFFGAHVDAERITLPVTTDRIAPTIARCIRIRAPNACSSEPLF
ncbi:MAG: alkaline phosphatase family protein [Prevotella sp.]|nr:alkaline phosphatase family protein [Prevotella sp.]